MIDTFEMDIKRILKSPKYLVLKRLVIGLTISQVLLTFLIPVFYTGLKVLYNIYGVTAFPILELIAFLRARYGFPGLDINAYGGAVRPRVEFNMISLFQLSLWESMTSVLDDVFRFEYYVFPVSLLSLFIIKITQPIIKDNILSYRINKIF